MADYAAERILNWVSDFCQSDALKLFPPELAEDAQSVLEVLLTEAHAHRGGDLERLEEEDVRHALLGGVARLALPEPARAYVPSLCRAFLEDLQKRGRIGNGMGLGRFAGALRQPYLEASGAQPATFRNPGAKIGRNDPCPCGSGKKFKKCCGRG
jgi:hypothetical protein